MTLILTHNNNLNIELVWCILHNSVIGYGHVTLNVCVFEYFMSAIEKTLRIRICHPLPEVVVDPEERVRPGSVDLTGDSRE